MSGPTATAPLSSCSSFQVLLTARGWAAWLVLTAGLVLTVLVVFILREQQARAADKQFQQNVHDVEVALTERLKHHEQILLGGAGLFDASEQVTREEWRAYVDRLRLQHNYPGIQGVGFSVIVQPRELAAHIDAVRVEGFPDYSVRPVGDREIYTSIIYLEPFAERNLAAFGYDMYSEPVRRRAMDRAISAGATSISGKVRLVQETHGSEQSGFLMYVPVYRKGMALETEEQRWQALKGFVYSPYRVDDLMHGILGASEIALDFTIHEAEQTLPEGLMHDSSMRPSPTVGTPDFRAVRRLDVYGQVWTVTLHSRPTFTAQFSSPLPWLTPLLGMAISGLLFVLVFTLLTRREHALALADEMSERRAESEARFHQLFLSVGQGVVIHDASGGIVDANPAAETILGISLDQMSSIDTRDSGWRTVRDDGSDFPSVQHPARVALREGRAVADVTIGLWHPTFAAWRWILVSAYPGLENSSAWSQRVYSVFSDITERKRSEILAREQSEHTQAVLDNMVDGIITIDAMGIIQSSNPAATRIFGYTAEEMLGRNVSTLMPSPHREAHNGYLHNYQATGVARIIGIGREVEGQRQDGSLFPMDLAVSEVTRQGHPLYVGMVRDISERKRIERMKSEFVSTVSHELRTPLTSISGALGLVVGGACGNLPAQARQMLDIACKNSQRLTLLINDLLDIEKMDSGKLRLELQVHALMPLIEQALETNRLYGSERQVSLLLNVSAVDVHVRVDSLRFLQVMANLISNAIKYSSAGGSVEIDVQVAASRAKVAVIDNGPGVPEAFRSRIFQRFSQADATDTRQQGGTGLGLAITRELVERMGGAIGYSSKEGEGATFWFELPLQSANTQASMAASLLSTVDADGPRILVVEDDPDIAQLLGRILTQAGYQIDIALNGHDALAALERTAYSAVSLDLMLPDLSGLDIIRRVRQRPETQDLPIVVVSAKMEDGRLALNGDFCHIDWLSKPIDERQLLAMLERQVSLAGKSHRRVLHVEDDDDLCQVVRSMVGERFEVEQARSVQEARARLLQEHFDLVVLDIGLPDGNGWSLLNDIRTQQPAARIVILSATEISADEASKVDAVLLKSVVSPQGLIAALTQPARPHRIKGATND